MSFKKGHIKYTTKGDFKKGIPSWNSGTGIWLSFKCLECGKEYKVRKCHTHNGISKYCSKECFIESLKGIRLDKRKRLTKICKQCNKSFEVRPCEEYRKFCSKKCVGLNKPIKPHWGKYKEINMRSGYEIGYAKYLDKNNIKWLYECKTFDLGDTTYTPDFYLPESDTYIEIKGWMQSKALIKINKFIKQYPEINYIILKYKKLKSMGVIK